MKGKCLMVFVFFYVRVDRLDEAEPAIGFYQDKKM